MKTKLNSSLGTWIFETRSKLKENSELPGLEARILAAHVLKKPREWVMAHDDVELSPQILLKLDQLLQRYLSGEPLPYLLGHWAFFGLDFVVSPAVLIPRPETELLVERALSWLKAHPERRCAADVGTGSGCIAVSLAKHCPNLTVVASDLSRDALKVTQKNIVRHEVQNRVFPVNSNLLDATSNTFDLVCANLPYIPSRKISGLKVSKHEPNQALDGGEDGLYWINKLLADTRRYLRPGGYILLEIEAEHGLSAPAAAKQLVPDAEVELIHDLTGKPRLLAIQT